MVNLALVGVSSMAVFGVLVFVVVRAVRRHNRRFITCQWTRIDHSTINKIDCARPGDDRNRGFGFNFAVSTNATKIVVGVKWQGMCFYKRMEKALEGYNLEEQRFDELVYGKEIAMSDSGDVTAYESREPYTATVGFPSEPHQGNDTQWC